MHTETVLVTRDVFLTHGIKPCSYFDSTADLKLNQTEASDTSPSFALGYMAVLVVLPISFSGARVNETNVSVQKN